jgi:hypothetical protein
MALKIEGVGAVPKVQRDNPTGNRTAKAAPSASSRNIAPQADTQPAEAAEVLSIDDALAAPHRPVTNRISGSLWDQLAARADMLGVPLRVVLTDMVVRALEQEPADHADNVKQTRRREALAKLDRA